MSLIFLGKIFSMFNAELTDVYICSICRTRQRGTRGECYQCAKLCKCGHTYERHLWYHGRTKQYELDMCSGKVKRPCKEECQAFEWRLDEN